ncbi:type II toxin-antitoxin system HicA family toxin [uncultured Clostridium sp.]|uniref:type II toxin-antitoxin system HicA family toxin n=1 Tax=uncultured Clostridium sp. TaxID=59620 RepID=UPI0026F38B3B|nr:type II toxin-antitoxin system HicA family toxin [uncultured Clostridium sp.]
MAKHRHGNKREKKRRGDNKCHIIHEFIVRQKLLHFLEECAQSHKNYMEDKFFEIYEMTKDIIYDYKDKFIEDIKERMLDKITLDSLLEGDFKLNANNVAEAIMRNINKSFTSDYFKDIRHDLYLLIGTEYSASFYDYYDKLLAQFEGIDVDKEFKGFESRQKNHIIKTCRQHSQYIMLDFREEIILAWQLIIAELNKKLEGKVIYIVDCKDYYTYMRVKLSYKIHDSIIEFAEDDEEFDEIKNSCDNIADYKYIDDYRQLNKLAELKGFKYERSNGDHGIFKNDKGRIVVIPQGRNVGKGLSLKIQKSLDLEDIA